MRKIRDVLRLSAAGMSKRQIAASLGVSATAAGECIRRAPRTCAGCGQPFPRESNRVRCLHTENGYFCDEFCETDHRFSVAAFTRSPE
jgi:transposase